MNYTGNPRHLRKGQHLRRSQILLGPRHRRPAATILERPWLDICGSFQKQRDAGVARATGGDADSAVAPSATLSMEDGRGAFQAKRRRLLEQADWLGLDIAAPINIYELRAAKEQKRLANGPFMRPLFSQPSDSSTTSQPRGTKPSLPSRSPAPTSHSSTSHLSQASIPSIHSSQHGSAFVPSYCTTPANTNRVTSPSKSTCSSSHSWNSFVKPSMPSVSGLEFIPETEDLEFCPRQLEEKQTADMKRIWTIIEERKREDNMLRREFGWESQSGVGASQMSMQPSQQVFCQSQTEVAGIQNEETIEGPICEVPLAVAAVVVGPNDIIKEEDKVPEHPGGEKKVVNLAEQDDEDDDVGLPWF